MSNFATLSKTRKALIQFLIEKFPEISTTGTITFSMIRSVWVNGKAFVDPQTQQKYGYPLWMTVEKEYRTQTRGTYKVPLPTLESLIEVSETKIVSISKEKELTKEKKQNTMVVISDDEFMAELAEAGIEL